MYKSEVEINWESSLMGILQVILANMKRQWSPHPTITWLAQATTWATQCSVFFSEMKILQSSTLNSWWIIKRGQGKKKKLPSPQGIDGAF